jgi:hypothetical protein
MRHRGHCAGDITACQQLKAELRSGRGLAVGALLKSIHDASRGLRTEINFSHDSPGQGARRASHPVRPVEGRDQNAAGRVRRLLRPRPIKEIAPNSLDQNDVRDTEAQISSSIPAAPMREACTQRIDDAHLDRPEHYLDPATAALVGDSVWRAIKPAVPAIATRRRWPSAARYLADYAALLLRRATSRCSRAQGTKGAASRPVQAATLIVPSTVISPSKVSGHPIGILCTRRDVNPPA